MPDEDERWHLGDRLRGRRKPHRRLVHVGDEFTIDEEMDGSAETEQVAPAEEAPIEIQGEPWGWTKGPPYPRGWREDGIYDRGGDRESE
jgi:hypothetical protein